MLNSTSNKVAISLLSPAKNFQVGKAAIDCGADAVYIGAPQFSARYAAGNSIDQIKQLIDYAHPFGVKVLVALNTILSNEELKTATQLIWELYEIGTDALIIQDLGLLKQPLPPIRIHASTQCDNRDADKVLWLEKLGFSRAVLARELSIDEIKKIHSKTSIELEAFVHGALCVSYSGKCYLSEAVCSRSANRGRCAQMCRQQWDLLDKNKEILYKSIYPLSLHDMDRSQHIEELLNAGITTLKIEGRLKDEAYVRNITAYYRLLLDRIFAREESPYCKSSYGKVYLNFTPDPKKTFHRGSTDYFLHSRTPNMANFQTPKSTGEYIGQVIKTENNKIYITNQKNISLHNGDGLCYQDNGVLINTVENADKSTIVTTRNNIHINRGTAIYRNYDSQFINSLNSQSAKRKIPVDIFFSENTDGFTLKIGNSQKHFLSEKVPAKNAELSMKTLISQLQKLGDTIYEAGKINISLSMAYFIPISDINEWRRQVTTQITVPQVEYTANSIEISPLCNTDNNNIFNSSALEIYESANATTEPAFELSHNKNQALMRCKYCILFELGQCRKNSKNERKEPVYISNNKNIFKLNFNCQKCEMTINFA